MITAKTIARNLTEHQGYIDESLYPEGIFPVQRFPSICQILLIGLEDEMSVVEEVLKLLDTVVGTVSFFL